MVASQRSLAAQYICGDGVEQDDATAAYWYLKAAEQGDAQAQYLLGMSYAVLAEWQKAVPLFTAAAEQQDWQAMVCLSALYARGVGVKRSLDRAENYNRMARRYVSQEDLPAWYNDFILRAKL